ncbi:hypothetical protein F4818DRAFT_239698 [Hypoxylon cercidicola]|nr:hypothetical protein F4818DRAFT_239698 [Hypoxylon cercidicola]
MPTPDRPPTPEPGKSTHRAAERTHYSIEVEITPVIRSRRAVGSTASQQRPQSQDLSDFLKRHVEQRASVPPRSPKGCVSSSLDGIREEEEHVFSQSTYTEESCERSSQYTTSNEEEKGKFVQRDFASFPARKITFSINDAGVPSTSFRTRRNHHKRISAPPVLISTSSTEGPNTGDDQDNDPDDANDVIPSYMRGLVRDSETGK